MDEADALPYEMRAFDPSFDAFSDPDLPGAVKDLLAAAGGPAQGHELAGEAEAVSAFAAVMTGSHPAPALRPRRTSLLDRIKSRKLAVAAVIGGVSLFSGLTAAGALPGAAQQAASDALAKIGITVPAPNDHAGDLPGARGQSTGHQGTDDHSADQTTTADEHSGQGADISTTARTTDATGVDKGAQISTQASDGKSQAGADHTAPAPGAADEHKPAETPSTVPSRADDGASHKPAEGSHP